MSRRLALVLATSLALSVAATGAGAGTVNGYTSLWVLGDSLSDPGNLHAATGGAVPESPPYYEGRRSNGPVWAEHVAKGFSDKGLATQSFAYAYANALPTDDIALGLPIQVPDMPDQIANFAKASKGKLGKAPVAALWFGSNDIFLQIAANPDPVAVATTATAVAAGVKSLAALGVNDFLVFNLPALEKAPQFALLRPEAAPLAKLGSDTFNAILAKQIAELTDPKIRVDTMNMYTAFNALIADPAKFGLTNAKAPCLIPDVSLCTSEQAEQRAFFDPVHPNSVVHSEIADLVGTKIAPVPLPLPFLLLIGGLASIGLAARRHT